VPIVFLDTPGDFYWERVHAFVEEQLVSRGLVSTGDTRLYRITDSVDEAVDEILRFYSNFHTIRYVGDQLVIRLRYTPSDEQLAELTTRFSHLVSSGKIRRVEPFAIERRNDEHLDLPRIAFAFAKHGYGDLRAMIDMLNTFAPSAGTEQQ